MAYPGLGFQAVLIWAASCLGREIARIDGLFNCSRLAQDVNIKCAYAGLFSDRIKNGGYRVKSDSSSSNHKRVNKKPQSNTKKWSTWNSIDDKTFLIICNEFSIAQELDNRVTSARVSNFSCYVSHVSVNFVLLFHNRNLKSKCIAFLPKVCHIDINEDTNHLDKQFGSHVGRSHINGVSSSLV